MKVISKGRYECPHCGTIFEPDEDDIDSWWSVKYCECPTCEETLHIAGSQFDRWLCPYDISGRKAIRR